MTSDSDSHVKIAPEGASPITNSQRVVTIHPLFLGVADIEWDGNRRGQTQGLDH